MCREGARIENAQVPWCPDDHGNEATGATQVSLGETTDGELESYAAQPRVWCAEPSNSLGWSASTAGVGTR